MEFGFNVATRGPLANPDSIKTIVQHGEELGFDIASVSDHIVVPRKIDSLYPYSETGEFIGNESGYYMEQLATLSFLAGITSTLRLLTAVMVLPHRNPVLTAKILATIDVLSKGRIIVGCGVGWMREEFNAIGAPSYDERGSVSDEYIRIMKELWTKDDPSFNGKYARFSNITFAPKPVQKPHPPIWIGGESPPALRRAATLGNAWYPIGNNPRFPVGTLEQLKEYLSRLHHIARESDRAPSEIDLAYSVNRYNDREAETLLNGKRRSFTGSCIQVAGDIKAFEEIGVRHLILRFEGDTIDSVLAHMERFASKVRPLVIL